MNLHQGYDAKAFCKDAVSNWSSAEPELLEWTDAISEIENAIAISFVEFNELPELGFPEASFLLVKEALKKFSIV